MNMRAHLELNPPASPNYAPPPWTYTRARILNVVCKAPNQTALNRWVPAPLKPSRSDGLFVMFFLKVPSIPELGADYHSTESGILIPAQSPDGKTKGSTFAIMFVDNDIALAGGREIWGYPKKLGTVRYEENGAMSLSAAAHHMAFRDRNCNMIFSADIAFDGSGEHLWEIVAGFEPRLLRRAIPDPYVARTESDQVLQVVHTPGTSYEQRTGRGTVRFGETAEGLKAFGEVEVLGATFRVCDFILPYAKRL